MRLQIEKVIVLWVPQGVKIRRTTLISAPFLSFYLILGDFSDHFRTLFIKGFRLIGSGLHPTGSVEKVIG
jgi:hypothetical protein